MGLGVFRHDQDRAYLHNYWGYVKDIKILRYCGKDAPLFAMYVFPLWHLNLSSLTTTQTSAPRTGSS